ncbi:MAG: hypothetical protein F6J86_41470, partial [Symploca sp. SIO1B1]|nr:hypothetical protein [Symploca sp. SIO1B1]
MLDWKWFLRVALLGLVGTAVVSQVFSTLEQNKRRRDFAVAITPQEAKTQTDLLYPLESSILPEDISVPLFPSESSTQESLPKVEQPLPTLPSIKPQELPALEKPLSTLPPIPKVETPSFRQRFSLPSYRSYRKRPRQFSASSTDTSQETPQKLASALPTNTPKVVFPSNTPQNISQSNTPKVVSQPNTPKVVSPQLKEQLSLLSKPDSKEKDKGIADTIEPQNENNLVSNNGQQEDKTSSQASCLSSDPDSCTLEPVSALPTNTPEQTSNTPEQTSQELPSEVEQEVVSTSLEQEANLDPYSALFATPVSLGIVAIGVAEGNYRLFIEDGNLYVEKTPLYFGHTDPGNLSWGEVVTNYGPCSDQGRSGGNLAVAEKLCSQRSLAQVPTHLADLQAAGIDPRKNIEFLLNTADLYNQASVIHSRRFPEALILASLTGQTGVEAIAWARTASFYLNENQEIDFQEGENKATGLLGICA